MPPHRVGSFVRDSARGGGSRARRLRTMEPCTSETWWSGASDRSAGARQHPHRQPRRPLAQSGGDTAHVRPPSAARTPATAANCCRTPVWPRRAPGRSRTNTPRSPAPTKCSGCSRGVTTLPRSSPTPLSRASSDPGDATGASRRRGRPPGHGGARAGGAGDGARAQRLRHAPASSSRVSCRVAAANASSASTEVAAERRTVRALRGAASSGAHRDRSGRGVRPRPPGGARPRAHQAARGRSGAARSPMPRVHLAEVAPRGEYVLVLEGAPVGRRSPPTSRSLDALRMALAGGADRRTAIATVMATPVRPSAGCTTSPSRFPDAADA